MEDLGKHLLTTLIYFWPAYLGNMMPVIIYNIPGIKPLFSARIDFGASFRGEPLFGKGKTWMGFFAGAIGGLLAGLMIVYGFSFWFEWLDLARPENWYLFGVTVGIGALTGDLIKSFLKRRLRIRSGQPWIIFDQIDLIIGAYLFSWILFPIPIINLGIGLIITPLLHFGINILAYKLKLKSVWW